MLVFVDTIRPLLDKAIYPNHPDFSAFFMNATKATDKHGVGFRLAFNQKAMNV